MQRRHFIRNTVLGTLGASLALPGGARAGTTATTQKSKTDPGPFLLKGSPDTLKITPADAEVLGLVSSFSGRVLFVGGCIAGKSGQGAFRSTHLLASIADFSKYQAFLTGAGAVAGNGMCIGNNLCFNYQQTTFELEALLPDDFKKRLANLQSGLYADGSPIIYAHDALTYEPSKKALTDPFRAFSGIYAALKRINTPGSYAQLAEGNLAIPAYRLTTSARDQADLNVYLNQTVTNATEARTLIGAVLQNLSLSSQVCTSTDIRALCGTRMVRSASQLTLGCDSSRVAGNFARLRAFFSTDITDGTIWHTMFQTAEMPPDGLPQAASLAMAGGCKFKTFLTMQELQKTGQAKGTKNFRMYA